MSPREHGHVAELPRERDEFVPRVAEFGHEHLLDRAFHHEALGEVVHVLGGEPEVNPRVNRLVGLGADEVLDGLHVVVRRRESRRALDFEPFHEVGVVGVELLVERPEVGALGLGERKRRRVEVGEREEVLYFDLHAGAHERGLADVRRERCGSRGVSPVERGHRVQRVVPVGVGHV